MLPRSLVLVFPTTGKSVFIQSSRRNKKEASSDNFFVKWISELGSKDVLEVGGKGANLGEMTSIKMPVPIAFVVTSKAYETFLEKSGIAKEIYDKLNSLDIENTSELNKASKDLQNLIETKEIYKEIINDTSKLFEMMRFDMRAIAFKRT